MAVLNDNAIYLRLNNVNVEARWKTVEMSLSVGDEDITAGSGTDWEAHAGKLRGVKIKITLVYDDVAAATDAAAIWVASHVMGFVYGPEGSTTGKPCHNQSMLVTGITGPSTNVEKTEVVWEIEGMGTGTPTKNIYAGDTF
jgi:hypothetical protein